MKGETLSVETGSEGSSPVILDDADRFVAERLRLTEKPLRDLLSAVDDKIDSYPVGASRKTTKRSDMVDDTFKLIVEADIPPEQRASVLVEASMIFQALEGDEELAATYGEKMRGVALPAVMGTRELNRFYKEVGEMLLSEGSLPEAVLTQGNVKEISPTCPTIARWPEAVRFETMEWLVGKGIVTRDEVVASDGDGGERVIDFVYRLKGKNPEKAAKVLKHGHLGAGIDVKRLYNVDDDAQVELKDVVRLQKEHDKERRVKTMIVETGKDGYSILPINELRIGHQDGRSGLKLVMQELERVKGLRPEDKPDVVLISNLIQGDFEFNHSKRRAILAEGLGRNNVQLGVARDLINDALSTGVPVALNLGPDDKAIAEDYAIGVIAEMNKIMKSGPDGHIPYYMQNKLMQSRLKEEHLQFQLDYALPLCYRLGRTLRSADEISVLTDGEVTVSEYLLIYDFVKNGTALPPELGVDGSIIVPNGVTDADGLTIYQDFDMHFVTNSGEYDVQYRHNTGFTAESLLGNHMDTPLKQQGNLGYMGEKLPSMFLSGRAQEFAYGTSSNVPVVSLPGLADPIKSLDSDMYHSTAPGDPSRRFNTNRRRLIKPALDTIEMRDDGTIVHNIASGRIMEKARQLPRMAIFEFADFQTGSPTARADYQVKFLSMVLDKAAEMPVAIHFAGDIIHGNIYPNMAHEAQAIGLMRPESQKLALSEMFRKVFEQAPQSLIMSVVDVLVQQGNHDEVQRIKAFGNANHDSNIDYLVRDAKDMFDITGQPSKVRHDAVFMTEDGTPVNTWVGRSHYGPFSINTAHYHIAKGQKGGGGGLAAYHALQRAQGIGSAETPDIIIGAHWHNEQLALVGDVLSVVSGAMAGRSEFEDTLGYDARVAGTMIEIGGNKPISVHFIHEKALIGQKVKYGFFNEESLHDYGYHTDKGFDPYKHGIFSFSYLPKDALQKAILDINRRASERTEYEGMVRNPNLYGKKGQPKHLNLQTSRVMAATAMSR